MLTAAIKEKIKLAIEADCKPKRSKNGDFLLRFGGGVQGGYRFLVKDGHATLSGDYWKELTGEELPTEGWDRTQTEFITCNVS